jgi:hypothetical protein
LSNFFDLPSTKKEKNKMPEKVLQLVLSFDNQTQTYKPVFHNLEVEQAGKQIEQLGRDQITAVAIKQGSRHKASDAERCRACKEAAGKYSARKTDPAAERQDTQAADPDIEPKTEVQ